MSAAACEASASASADDAKPTPFSQQWVTLSKQEHIELVMQARSWKSLHERAVRRNQWLQGLLRRQHSQAEQRETALRGQLDLWPRRRSVICNCACTGARASAAGRWRAECANTPRRRARAASSAAHRATRVPG